MSLGVVIRYVGRGDLDFGWGLILLLFFLGVLVDDEEGEDEDDGRVWRMIGVVGLFYIVFLISIIFEEI